MQRATADVRPQSTRLPHLDGLRGIAVVLVIVFHANFYFSENSARGAGSKALDAVLGGGWIGVNLFFVLSGFLITGLLLDAGRSRSQWFLFYARRALRIFPLYFAFLAFVALPTIFAVRVPFLVPLAPEDLASLAGFYYNFRLSFVTHSPLVNIHHFWSLCVEEHFYLIWPFLVMRCSTPVLLWFCVAGMLLSFLARIVVVLGGFWLPMSYYLTVCQLDGLLAGSFVAAALRVAWAREHLARASIKVLCATSFALLMLIVYQGHLYNMDGPGVSAVLSLTIGIAASSMLFASIIAHLATHPTSPAIRLLSAAVLTRLGVYSYGMYVFHFLILNILYGAARRHLPDLVTKPDVMTKPLLAITAVACSAGVAMVSYHAFEVHFLRLKERISIPQWHELERRWTRKTRPRVELLQHTT